MYAIFLFQICVFIEKGIESMAIIQIILQNIRITPPIHCIASSHLSGCGTCCLVEWFNFCAWKLSAEFFSWREISGYLDMHPRKKNQDILTCTPEGSDLCSLHSQASCCFSSYSMNAFHQHHALIYTPPHHYPSSTTKADCMPLLRLVYLVLPTQKWCIYWQSWLFARFPSSVCCHMHINLPRVIPDKAGFCKGAVL